MEQPHFSVLLAGLGGRRGLKNNLTGCSQVSGVYFCAAPAGSGDSALLGAPLFFLLFTYYNLGLGLKFGSLQVPNTCFF